MKARAPFGVGFARQQHAAHVRVHDDAVGRQFRVLDAGQRTHLRAVLGVDQRVLVSDFRQAQRLHAHAQAGRVHEDEHGVEALVRLADDPAFRAVQVHLAGRIAVDAHFFFDGAAGDRVAFTDRTVRVRQEFRHQEQRDAFRAFRCVRHAGQHQVQDIFRHVVLAGRDENLVAGDGPGTVCLRQRLRAQQAQVGAAVRFGQAHGARPFARHQFRQIHFLLVVGAVFLQALVGAVRQARVHGPGLVRRVQHFIERIVQHDGQALAAVLRIASQGRPAAFDVLFIRFFKAFRRGHVFRDGIVVAAFAVAGVIQGEQHFGSELAALFQYLVDDIGVDVGVRRHLLQFFFHLQELMQNELHIPDWRDVLTHNFSPEGV